jgi:hypothetical protein
MPIVKQLPCNSDSAALHRACLEACESRHETVDIARRRDRNGLILAGCRKKHAARYPIPAQKKRVG